jgi:inositol transport system ATP-binding protein
MSEEYILELKNISKTFPGVKALDDVQLKIRKGTVHALMGENGAGKSTLMKIIIGIYTADSGHILFDGKKIDNHSINKSLEIGISMIHQELNPIPQMTVAENIYLGREPLKGAFLDKKKMVSDTQKLLDHLGISNINPKSKMVELSIAKMQMVEIAKAISYNSKLIIMDEPTSAITDKEVEQLFRIIREQKKTGVAFIFITHKMEEVFQITDEITVFRDGCYVGCERAEDLNNEKLIEMMVGREITEMFPKEEAVIGDVVLEVKNLKKEGLFEDISFNLRKGEILGLAGLMGAGRTEVVETLFGYRKADSGTIILNGKEIKIKSPADALKHGIALLTEDRKETGCFLPLSITDNMIVCSIDSFNMGFFLNKKKINQATQDQKDKLDIKTPGMGQLIKNLSGGNQQKVLVARWLLTGPDIFIVDEPTRGIDVGAKSEIHKLLSLLAKEGKAVIMISSEMPEILGMSDRILVMHEGKLTGEVMRKDATQTKIMEYATATHNK